MFGRRGEGELIHWIGRSSKGCLLEDLSFTDTKIMIRGSIIERFVVYRRMIRRTIVETNKHELMMNFQGFSPSATHFLRFQFITLVKYSR